ncbi:hypothetical protein NM208_g11652 [Fusarium decemcellulare]|uniref:Uncharacterized protein n=1 Tax=Fusarium decemcellulare TaxID=57161 RepID=A0ACC1RUP6_9HYPO|nr:hypothetical protein NM208_g11652 [Fusarium decemcellulare]
MLREEDAKERALQPGYERANHRILMRYYSEILIDHGLKYLSLHQQYLRRLSILWVAIIREVEGSGAAMISDDGLRYSFGVDSVDWIKVSKAAIERLPGMSTHPAATHPAVAPVTMFGHEE